MKRWHAWQNRLLAALPLFIPLLVGVAVYYFLREPIALWRQGEAIYDDQAMREWVRESRVGSPSLPELIKDFLVGSEERTKTMKDAGQVGRQLDEHGKKRTQIQEMLDALCVPLNKVYPGQLPLFPTVYRVEVHFSKDLQSQFDPRLKFDDIVWESDMPRHPNQFRILDGCQLFGDDSVTVNLQYSMHAYNGRQSQEKADDARRRLVNIWVLAAAFACLLAMLWLQRRQAERERLRQVSVQQIQESQRKHLEEELRRQEAERKQEEAERKQLEEELRRQEAERKKQEAERQALELKSQMFHSIGIMAKSYAHNIKNLLVRPNDLLRRCLEENPSGEDETRMLGEIKQTLSTVTERLQEILQTVQRDPNQFERVRIDLNALAADLHATWAEQAESKWKMVVELDLLSSPRPLGEGQGARDAPAPLYVSGDRSHLQQTLENFLFNARDAIAEMRNYLRKQARPDGTSAKTPLDEAQRQALIAAAGWKGRVLIRTDLIDGRPVLEVQDNGIGMTPETIQHCTEPHYSTKRNNALYAGMSAGMGLGLSFVQMILEHHGATIEIESAPLRGARFRVRFPAA